MLARLVDEVVEVEFELVPGNFQFVNPRIIAITTIIPAIPICVFVEEKKFFIGHQYTKKTTNRHATNEPCSD